MKIIVRNATKSFGENLIFKNVNVIFETGNFYIIRGQNGCGKTVFLKTICGYLTSDSGEIFQDEKKIRVKNNYIDNAGIIVETPQFLSHLTLLDNLKLLKKMSIRITDAEIEKWINFYGIESFKNTKYKNCSLGTKQKMSLIQAFIHQPDILILDEPFNSLDKESVKKTENYLLSIKNKSIIILSTHINDSTKYIYDYGYIFEEQDLKIKY